MARAITIKPRQTALWKSYISKFAKQDVMVNRVEGFGQINKYDDTIIFFIYRTYDVIYNFKCCWGTAVAFSETRLHRGEDTIRLKVVSELFVDQFVKDLGQTR